MANGNGKSISWRWLATAVLIPALVIAGGWVRANDRADIDSNTVHIIKITGRMDSLVTELRVQTIRDSFFQSQVLHSLRSLTKAAGVVDSSGSP